MDALLPIIGRWNTSGQVVGQPGEIVGTDTYELLPGIPWIAHTVDVQMPDGHVSSYELIGGAHPDGGWGMHSFDESHIPSLMRLTDEGSGVLLIHGNGVRSWLTLTAGPDHMVARWERLDGGEWVPWMQLRFDRA